MSDSHREDLPLGAPGPEDTPICPELIEPPSVVVAEVVPEFDWRRMPMRPPVRRRVWLPLVLFVATCLSTWLVGAVGPVQLMSWRYGPFLGLLYGLVYGLQYAVPVMTILLCHEMGHFLQARRYGVFASYPYFIPMPLSPIGTFGAVIAMNARVGGRRALFDIGITGPLAGLVPTLIFCAVGISWSTYVPGQDQFGDPLLFKWFAVALKGPIPEGQVIQVHPIAFAGWVGLLITSLNLFPIGQLDGGHVLYALLRWRARWVATAVLLGAVAAVAYFELWGWSLMLLLVVLIGPGHPPTADDTEPLGFLRTVLGWLTLAFIPIGFTPTPFLVMK